jgi:flagellar protein FliO/FliZ
VETVTLIGRLLVSLAAVLGLMWVIARRVKRPGGARTADLVDVLSRRQLSRTASVAVVRVLDRALIVGITDGQVSLIGETDLAAAEQATETAATRGPVERLRTARPMQSRPKPLDLTTKIGPDGRILTPAARPSPGTGALAGSALSPATWRQTVDTLRSLGARKT